MLETKVEKLYENFFDQTSPGYTQFFSKTGPKYSTPIDIDSQLYQYKFRKFQDGQIKYNPDPDFSSRWIEAQTKKKDYRDENGILSQGYYQSELYNEIEALSTEACKHTIARAKNYQAIKAVEKAVSKIEMTNYARKKAVYISRRVSELALEAGMDSNYEVLFYLLGEPNTLKIDDVEVADEQLVQPAFCKPIDGIGRTKKIVERKGKKIISMGHSHVDFSAYFSRVDDAATYAHYINLGQRQSFGQIGGEDEIRIFYAMVFNELNDEPALRAIVSIPHYYVEEGVVKRTTETLDFEATPTDKKRNNTNRWPSLVMIDEDAELDTESIDDDLIDRVTFDDGSRLSDYLKPKKILSIDDKFDFLSQRLETLEIKYDHLRIKYDSLTDRINKNYLFRLSEYAQRTEPNSALGIIIKIMAGEYRVDLNDIVDGNYEENQDNVRIWTWDDRIEAIKKVSEKENLNDGEIEQLEKIADSNQTLKETGKIKDLKDALKSSDVNSESEEMVEPSLTE